MIFLEENNPSAFTFTPLRGGDDTGFNENFKAAYDGQLKLNRTDSRAINLREEWDSVITRIKDETGKSFINPGNYLNSYSASPDTPIRGYNFSSKQIFDFIKERPDTFPDLINLDNDVIFEKAKKRAIKSLDVNADVAARQTTTGLIGEFLGGSLASITDLPNVAAIFLTGGSSTIVKETLKQALAAGASEAIIQTEVNDWYKSLNLPYDYKTFLANVALASAGAGVMTAGIMGAKPAYQLTKKQIINGIEALEKAKARLEGRPYEINPDIKVIKEIDEINETINQGNLLKDDAGDLEHNARVNQSYQAIENGDSTKITSAPPESAIIRPTDIHFHDNLNKEMFAYKPNDLLVDANLFQFKAGGDIMGVTERLHGVTQWDPVKANTAIVYEFADGRTFIADGHQRLALAKRLQEADPSLNIQIYAFKIREIDGRTPAYARAAAAGKNLAEGTGTLVDAAKILRDYPEGVGALPPRSAFIKQANELKLLKDKAWMSIVNETIPAHFGSIVGRYITDEAQQLAIIQLLRRLEPANAVQAEQIVRQAKEAGFVKTEQAGLFGDEDIAESLFLERAKILDRAMKELRKDKELFETLVKNATDIEEAGNTLAKLSNQEKEAIYGKAIAIIENNANVRGPISDALTRIAKAWKDGGGTKTETYVREFTESVRRAIEDGSYERVPNGGDRGDLGTPAQSNRLAEPGAEELKLFDEGTGSPGALRQADQLQDDLLQIISPDGIQSVTIPIRKLARDEIPQPNEPFVVFRFGNADETGLNNKNATNYYSLIETIDDGELGPIPGARLDYTDENAFIHAYVVNTPEPIGQYQGFNVGQKASETGTSVGAKTYYGGMWYSFAENGNWQAQKIGQIKAIDFAKQAEQISGEQFYKLPGNETIVEKVFAQNNIDINNPAITRPNEPRQGMNPDEVERNQLKTILDRGATVEEIEAHPAVVNAIELAKTIRETYLSPGYLTDEWKTTRQFDFAGESVTGYNNAVDRLYDQAKRLGWIDEQVPYTEGNVVQGRQATIILGPPAAGKSSIANRIAQSRGAAIIDSDEAKKVLPEYRDGIGANAVHEESQDIINLVLRQAVNNGDNIVIPKIGKSLNTIDLLINSLKEDGYTINLLNVAVPSDTAYVRMISRFINTGRLINPEYFRAIGDNPTKTYQALKQKGGLDGYAEIDYSGPKNSSIPVKEESGNILEGVSLRLRRGGDEGVGEIYRAPETGSGREFGEIESNPGLLDLDIPIAERIDPATGERVAQTVTVREMLEEFKQDDTMLNRLVGCIK